MLSSLCVEEISHSPEMAPQTRPVTVQPDGKVLFTIRHTHSHKQLKHWCCSVVTEGPLAFFCLIKKFTFKVPGQWFTWQHLWNDVNATSTNELTLNNPVLFCILVDAHDRCIMGIHTVDSPPLPSSHTHQLLSSYKQLWIINQQFYLCARGPEQPVCRGAVDVWNNNWVWT